MIGDFYMPVVIEKFMPELEKIKDIREKLKECKEDWLESKLENVNHKYIGSKTVTRILDYATDGITYWDFELVEQWREEVYQYDRNTGTWFFDGYVYRVKGYLFIPGLGQRSQYGSKVIIGSTGNSDGAYKSAASCCLNNCASMFGIGSSIYDKIKIETDENDYENLIQDSNYYAGHTQNARLQQGQKQHWNQQYQQQQGQYPS